MLHDIGMSIDYDDHHKHSRYLILNGGLPGFTPVETAIIAQSARYHRKGMPAPGPMSALFAPGDAALLDRCAVLLRLAEDLERSRDQLVRSTEMTAQRREVELRLVAEGESAVPRWAAGREGELFSRAFHRSLLGRGLSAAARSGGRERRFAARRSRTARGRGDRGSGSFHSRRLQLACRPSPPRRSRHRRRGSSSCRRGARSGPCLRARAVPATAPVSVGSVPL